MPDALLINMSWAANESHIAHGTSGLRLPLLTCGIAHFFPRAPLASPETHSGAEGAVSQRGSHCFFVADIYLQPRGNSL